MRSAQQYAECKCFTAHSVWPGRAAVAVSAERLPSDDDIAMREMPMSDTDKRLQATRDSLAARIIDGQGRGEDVQVFQDALEKLQPIVATPPAPIMLSVNATLVNFRSLSTTTRAMMYRRMTAGERRDSRPVVRREFRDIIPEQKG